MRTNVAGEQFKGLLAAALVCLLCAGATRAQPRTPPERGSGTLEGRITRWPTHPGASRPGIPDWAPIAAARIEIATPGGQKVATAQSDSAGMYSAQLAPGTYLVTVKSSFHGIGCNAAIKSPDGKFRSTYIPATVTIEQGATTHVDVQFDTGMR